ncbi:hypothetical protein ACFSO0_03475 [Brevibacillus sp. GCM10020057]|uniref:hypothetical protein n=1 Tax=Brevibacillus sp. GCM10020057 TaxID=3317327 RepID=UPI003643F443
MKRKKHLVRLLAVLLCYGWCSFAVHARAMEAEAAASLQPNVHHMQIVTKSADSIVIADTWQESVRKYIRIDVREYTLAGETVEAVHGHRSVVFYQDEKSFQVTSSSGKGAEISRDILDPFNLLNNKNSLSQAAVRWFGGARWEADGTVVFNGKQLVRQRYARTTADGHSLVNVAYLEPGTGLPVKEEQYIGDSRQPAITKLYWFEQIDDPDGFLFTSAASPILERDAPAWFCLALHAVMPIDPALNADINYIAVDMGDVPGLDEAGKEQVLRCLQTYKVKAMEASLSQLKEQGFYNQQSGALEGLLLRINEIAVSENKVVLNGFKYRGSGGAIGFSVVLELMDGRWQVTEAAPAWVS